MSSNTITIEVAGHPHKFGDVIVVNDQKYVVTKMHMTLNSSKLQLTTIFDFIAQSTYMSQIPSKVFEEGMTISDYVNLLCDEYEANCAC